MDRTYENILVSLSVFFISRAVLLRRDSTPFLPTADKAGLGRVGS